MQPFKLPLDKACNVIDYHPSGLWALEKASGVLSHPNPGKPRERSLLKSPFDFDKECYNWSDQTGTNRHLFLIHRLDSATSGILLVSDCPSLARQTRQAFANREIEKTYLALVHYSGQSIRSHWQDCLEKHTLGGKIRVNTARSGSKAITEAFLEQKKYTQFGVLALLRLSPKTGRTHQLRVQCAKRRLPIIGDRTYGNFQLNRKIARLSNCDRLFLHATKLKVKIEPSDQASFIWEVESPLPRAFGKLLG
ncbi:MAG: RNA pseudouridine synthase [Opitutae bacterium]